MKILTIVSVFMSVVPLIDGTVYPPPLPDPIVVDLAAEPYRGMGDNSTDWSGLVWAHFPASEIDTALDIIACESGGNPNAQNQSTLTAGLFQIHPMWAPVYGVRYEGLFAAEINVRVAAALWEDSGGWGPWACY